MSLWSNKKLEIESQKQIEDISSSMLPAVSEWLKRFSESFRDPYEMAVHIKNVFRVSDSIPNRRPNNYLDPGPEYKLYAFLKQIALSDSLLFLTILDYVFQNYNLPYDLPTEFGGILDDAGHMYTVRKTKDLYEINERLNVIDKTVAEDSMMSNKTYSSELEDAFSELYGTSPNPTQAAGEIFQSVESALKYFFGENRGNNLGQLISNIRNSSDWSLEKSPEGLDDAKEYFLSQLDFINKSYRKVKHGQKDKKLKVTKEHAETMLRVATTIIYMLENTIKITK